MRNDVLAVRIERQSIDVLPGDDLAQKLLRRDRRSPSPCRRRSRGRAGRSGRTSGIRCHSTGEAPLVAEDQQATVGQQQGPQPGELSGAFADNQTAIHAECRVDVAGCIDGDDRVTIPDDDAAIGARAENRRAIADVRDSGSR